MNRSNKISEGHKGGSFSFADHITTYLANIFRGRIEYGLIYSLRGAKHRVDYSVHIP